MLLLTSSSDSLDRWILAKLRGLGLGLAMTAQICPSADASLTAPSRGPHPEQREGPHDRRGPAPDFRPPPFLPSRRRLTMAKSPLLRPVWHDLGLQPQHPDRRVRSYKHHGDPGSLESICDAVGHPDFAAGSVSACAQSWSASVVIAESMVLGRGLKWRMHGHLRRWQLPCSQSWVICRKRVRLEYEQIGNVQCRWN